MDSLVPPLSTQAHRSDRIVPVERTGLLHVLPGSSAWIPGHESRPVPPGASVACASRVLLGDRALVRSQALPRRQRRGACDLRLLATRVGVDALTEAQRVARARRGDEADLDLDAALVVVRPQKRMVGWRHARSVLREAMDAGCWVEIVTPIRPGEDDGANALYATGSLVREVAADVPWHLEIDSRGSSREGATFDARRVGRALERAIAIGEEVGLHHLYCAESGISNRESTFCADCEEQLLVERFAGVDVRCHWTRSGECPRCRTDLAGVFASEPGRSTAA